MKAILASLLMVASLQANADVLRDISKYNLQDGVQLKGHDPVAPRLTEKATKGTDALALEFDDVTYKFSSVENQEAFLANPSLYEPTYGGWCAMAMAMNSLVDIKPELFHIMGDRIHYFSSKRAMRRFIGDAENLEAQADANWEARSGEAPPAN